MSQVSSAVMLLVMFVLAAGLIIAFVKGVLGARRTDESGYEVVGESGGMRRGIIRIGELAAILFVISSTLIGAIIGGTYSYLFWSALNTFGYLERDPSVGAMISALVGGGSFFMGAAMITAPIFATTATERNTRRTAAFLERLAEQRNRT